MKNFTAIPLLLGFALLLGACANPHQPTVSGSYAGQQARNIKALSGEDVAGLLAGHGMGLAKAAELNGYPGPMHVLEHAAALDLTAEQAAATKALFTAHKDEVRRLGKLLVAHERELDRLFATRTIDPAALERQLTSIAGAHAAVRGAHLRTHLTQTALLSSAQIERYAQLRGYGSRDHASAAH